MSYGGTDETVFSELLMIGYLCGFVDKPKVSNIAELMKKCISLGPQGYGLALYALIIALSGGTIPFFVMNPIPFGLAGRIKKMCVIDGAVLKKHGITQEEGFYTTSIIRQVGEDEKNVYEVEYPEAFGVAIVYEDAEGNENHRAFIIQHTQNSNYPWISVIPTDKNARKLVRLCLENKTFLTDEELLEMSRHVPKEKLKKKHRRMHRIHGLIEALEEAEDAEPAEEPEPEDEEPPI